LEVELLEVELLEDELLEVELLEPPFPCGSEDAERHAPTRHADPMLAKRAARFISTPHVSFSWS
jgi:hypothetical protein